MTLDALLRERIARLGPIGVMEYMALSLSHPEEGYYMRRDPFGVQGDFITAPEISQAFGELIGAWLADCWLQLGGPKAHLVELGPGRGTLMKDILRATKTVPGFHDAISVHLVEMSPALMSLQRQVLTGAHPRINWHGSLDSVPRVGALLLAANEFFDALPIHQYVQTEDGLLERRIALHPGNQKLEFILHKPLALIDGGASLPIGALIETSPAGRAVMEETAARLRVQNGAALIVDYGYTQGSKGDTLQAVKAHRYHDVLDTPGEADLTAHVDFAMLAEAAKAAGAKVLGPVGQGSFLARLGIAERTETLCRHADGKQRALLLSGLERLTSPDAMGDLFKVLAVASPHALQPAGFV